VSATAVGTLASTSAQYATAVGRAASVSGVNATAVGSTTTVSGTQATAVGFHAQASQANATAIGANAATTAANQVTLGGTGSSVRIGDVAASTAAQVGPVQAVTVDGSGTLGTTSVATAAALNKVSSQMVSALSVSDQQFADLSGRVDTLDFRLDAMNKQTRAGIAAAMALGGTMVVPDSNVSINFNAATYRGEQGFSGSVVARVAPKIYVSGGIAASTAKGSTGGRVGVAFGL
jgi:hypothetical protein